MRRAIAVATRGQARPTGRLLGGRVPRSPLRWRLTSGPWYDNNLAILELQADRLHFWWSRGEIREGDDPARPSLHRVATVDVPTTRGRPTPNTLVSQDAQDAQDTRGAPQGRWR